MFSECWGPLFGFLSSVHIQIKSLDYTRVTDHHKEILIFRFFSIKRRTVRRPFFPDSSFVYCQHGSAIFLLILLPRVYSRDYLPATACRGQQWIPAGFMTQLRTTRTILPRGKRQPRTSMQIKALTKQQTRLIEKVERNAAQYRNPFLTDSPSIVCHCDSVALVESMRVPTVCCML